jgi:myo-inositol-1-phosphate synthase
MQMKINFLCKDSILAAPIVLDIFLLLDLAQRAGHHGIQDWLSFFFKSPQHEVNRLPEHDLFAQERLLKDTLRAMVGEPRRAAERDSGHELTQGEDEDLTPERLPWAI